MRATGVIARFLSLMDVGLILLGVLMVILMHADVRRRAAPIEKPTGLAEVADVGFIYLYAGWQGEQNGRCYLLSSPNGGIEREVSTKTADDIKDILSKRERRNQVVMLLFSDDGWYSAWNPEKMAAIERTWNLKVIPIYNVRLPRLEKKP